jgi:leucyl aminopeptidase
MRADMAGGAAVLAAMRAALALGVRGGVRALIPCAENRGGPDAYRPGDVVTHFDGSTTEVTFTDAEGRLILGDAIAFAARAGAGAIVTVATLTDALALGPDLAAVLGTSGALLGALRDAGAAVGEPVWEMPLWPGYRPWLDSERADRRNWDWAHSVGGFPQANSIFAALFLNDFAAGVPFAHLDIVGPAVRATPGGDLAPTGFGAALLTEVIANGRHR